MIEYKLRPCPFCGRQVRLYDHAYYGCPTIEHITGGRECAFNRLTFYSRSAEKAAELWNMRKDTRWEDDVK